MFRKTTLIAALVGLAVSTPTLADTLMMKFRLKGLGSAPVEEVVSWDQFATDKGLTYQSGWNGMTWSNQSLTELPGASFPNARPSGSIYLNGNQLTNLAGLSSLVTVGAHLDLSNNRLANVNELSSLEQVTYTLNLQNNQLSSTSGLSNLRQLATLTLSGNQFRSVDGLRNLQTVQTLRLQNNPNLVDLSGLRNIQSIGTNISLDTGIHNRSGFVPIPADAPICQPDHTSRFGGGYAAQADVCAQSSANAWTAFATSNNLAYDANWDRLEWIGKGLSALPAESYPNPIPTSYIRVSSNNLTNLGGLNNLRTVSGDVDVSFNQLTHVNELSSLRNAQSVILNNNPITDLSGLGNLYSTNYLRMQNLEITNLNGLGPTRSIIGISLGGNPKLVDLSGLAAIPSVSWKVMIDKGIHTRAGFVPIPASAPLCQAGQADAFHDTAYASQAEVCATP